jgi:hypothetical protein
MTLNKILTRNNISKVDNAAGNMSAQYKAFELLFLHVLLQVYTEPSEALGVLSVSKIRI